MQNHEAQQNHKAQLLALKTDYEQRMDKIINHLQHPQDDLGQHWDDQAVATSQDDMRQLLLAEAQAGLAQVNAALLRLENGTYGECSECGEAISQQRLDAVPYASKCMKHAD